MSRFRLNGKNPEHEIIVGWDPPLQTFFAQVWDRSKFISGDWDDDEPALLWEGCHLRAVQTVDALEKMLKPFADLPPEVAAELRCQGRVCRSPE